VKINFSGITSYDDVEEKGRANVKHGEIVKNSKFRASKFRGSSNAPSSKSFQITNEGAGFGLL